MEASIGTLHASLECVEVFFNPETRASMPMPDTIRAQLEQHLVDAEEDWSVGLGQDT